jgi:Homeobox KN domain/C-terminal domain of homeodomain 1
LYESHSDTVFKPKADEVTVALPPYIEPAYTWLLNNLHNPYPSRDIKTSIVLQTGAPLKDIDNWFISVRKRIGWNKLRVKHYQNKRSKIVDAATRFFKQVSQPSYHEPTHISGIDPTASHDSGFKSIENRARDLYSDKLFETSSAVKRDDTLRYLMPDRKVRALAHEQHRRQVAKSRRGKDLQRLSAYPSPEGSPERSPEPFPEPTPEPSPSSPLNPNAILTTSRKRRNSDRDSPQLDIEDRRDPQKRSR